MLKLQPTRNAIDLQQVLFNGQTVYTSILFDLYNIDVITTDEIHTILHNKIHHVVFDKIHSTDCPKTLAKYYQHVKEKLADITKLSLCTAITFEYDVDVATVCNLLTSYKHLTKLDAVMLSPSRDLIDALKLSPIVSLSICIGDNTNICLFNELIATVPLNELTIRIWHDVRSEYVINDVIIQTLSTAPISRMNFTTNRVFSACDIHKIVKIISTNSHLRQVNIDKKINGSTISATYDAAVDSLFRAIVASTVKRFNTTSGTPYQAIKHILMSKSITEFSCEAYRLYGSDGYKELDAIMDTNYALTTCNLGSNKLLFAKQLARNRMISPKNVHNVLVDICIAILPHFDNIYCILWIFDMIDPNYYKYTDSKFKIGVIMNVKKSIDAVRGRIDS